MSKNSSKPAFGTDGWRAKIGEEFNLENCLLVIKSFLESVGGQNRKIIIGYDTRFLSKDISEEISKYISYCGHKVVLSNGPVPTPVVSFSVKNKSFDLVKIFILPSLFNTCITSIANFITGSSVIRNFSIVGSIILASNTV